MSEEKYEYILSSIKHSMDAHGWSQNNLADKSGVSSGTISYLLNRKHKPTTETLIKICTALGLNLLFV